MSSAYCGNLMTPMAATFNIVLAVLLELPDRNAVIKAQAPTALPPLVANIFLLYFLMDQQVMIKTVLLTGFEPFNEEPTNPSWEAVVALKGWRNEHFAVEVRRLPCVFGLANRVMAGLLEELQPDIVIATGQAGGRPELSLERVAINVDDASIMDNEGQQPVDTPIINGGPAAYFSTLPIKAIVQEMRERGLKAGVSQTAGTFVCNHVFYGLMHHTAGKNTRAGFIHVPFLPDQVAARDESAPSMELDEIIEGLRAAVEATMSVERDIALAAGAAH